MKQFYCTPVPSRRVSTNGKPEFRIAVQSAASVRISARQENRTVKECGCYPLQPDLYVNRVYPDASGLVGQVEFQLEFLSASGESVGMTKQNYEFISSDVHSSRLLDGCWVTIYHFSEKEAHYFNQGLGKLTDEDWKQVVYSMHKIGITSILIQNVFDIQVRAGEHQMTADTYKGRAFYDSDLYEARVPITARDPIESILTAADECDMTVFPGVGLYAWFDFTKESLEWHKRVARELYEKYGHHKSFYGWYISEEIMGALYYGYAPVPDEDYKNIQHFMAEFKRYVRQFDPTMPLALAPNNIKMHHYREEWRGILENLDILIPFAFARSENNIVQIAEMCRETGTHFWVDMEIFDFPFPQGLRPKNIDMLIKEIRNYDVLEQIYGYQYTGLLNEPGYRKNVGMEETEVLYTAYQKYQADLRK